MIRDSKAILNHYAAPIFLAFPPRSHVQCCAGIDEPHASMLGHCTRSYHPARAMQRPSLLICVALHLKFPLLNTPCSLLYLAGKGASQEPHSLGKTPRLSSRTTRFTLNIKKPAQACMALASLPHAQAVGCACRKQASTPRVPSPLGPHHHLFLSLSLVSSPQPSSQLGCAHSQPWQPGGGKLNRQRMGRPGPSHACHTYPLHPAICPVHE